MTCIIRDPKIYVIDRNQKSIIHEIIGPELFKRPIKITPFPRFNLKNAPYAFINNGSGGIFVVDVKKLKISMFLE